MPSPRTESASRGFCSAPLSRARDCPRCRPGSWRRRSPTCTPPGGLFIADEVQAGFGRFGSHMWGHQRLGVIPDIVTLGKPMGNGHPLAGVVARRDLVNGFASRNMYFNTFGGNPVSAAVGTAVLDVLAGRAPARKMPSPWATTRCSGCRSSPTAMRSSATCAAPDCSSRSSWCSDRKAKTPATAQTKRLVNLMRERGVLISRIGMHDNILKIRPPMPFSETARGSPGRHAR